MLSRRQWKRFKRFLRFAALWPFFYPLGAFPRRWARALGRVYSLAAYACLPRLRRLCSAQSAGVAGVVPGNVFTWIGRTAVDFLRLGKDPARLHKAQVEGLLYLEETETSGRPTLLATAHFGKWEVLGAWLAQRKRPIKVLYHPFAEERLDRFVRDIRDRAGVGRIPVGGSALPIRRALQNRSLVGVLLDRVPRGVGVESRFFGKECRTDPGTARLAMATDALVLVAAMWEDRQGNDQIRFWPPLDAREFSKDGAGVTSLVHELDRRVEEMVRIAPNQWPWFYPRWKIRGSRYDGVAQERAAIADQS